MPWWTNVFGGGGLTAASTTISNPIWITTTVTIPTSQTAATSQLWYDDQATGYVYSSATSGPVWASNANNLYQQAAHNAALLQQQHSQLAQQGFQFALHRPHGVGQLFMPSRPAIITHQEEARREQELYRRAIAEHDEQEAARLLRQIEARERAIGEQRRLMEQQRAEAHERQVQFEAARTVARDLLLSHLTPQQRQTFDANGWFIIEGGRTKTKYRINTRSGCAGNIDVLRGHNDQVTHRLCCHAPSHIPMGDQWLSQKIMLELAEDDFLRIANSTRVA